MSSRIHRNFAILAQREQVRRENSAAYSANPKEVHPFYSVKNSLAHRHDNRYSNILAYDRTAVVVNGNYLNANVVDDGKGGLWVAAQAPPPRAFDSFFRAIYTGAAIGKQPKDALIVQLTGWEERGITKADPYLDHKMDGIILLNAGRRRLEGLSSTLSEMVLQGEDRSVNLHHYHFDAWPDHGVPKGPGVQALRALVLEIEAKRKELDCEVWVHCSAGVGRTGTFIALSSLLTPGVAFHKSPLGLLPEAIHDDMVAQTVDTIRESRGMLVQNLEQYSLIYEMQ
ncbi:hypothetical protein B9479_007370 [Cryptococcus floricola]|uniref:Tyrosine specific protein phosphatases domain-containing protein n=1 Tax=Cryptococcus floricola TaxID=2591691 RepID=A0A5D3API0_9TREE|nr:hypothetical protein B9479_007370 [Cryptococcus floricola]